MNRLPDRQVFECASPLVHPPQWQGTVGEMVAMARHYYGGRALFDVPVAVDSGRGLPHSKTLARRGSRSGTVERKNQQ